MISALSSCRSSRIEPDLSASDREIVQLAQTAYDDGWSDDAVYYYEILLKRYGMDASIFIEGKYEIAHIYFKEKNWNKAVPLYEEILSLYDTALPGQLPGSYYKLAANDYSKIPADKKTSSTPEE